MSLILDCPSCKSRFSYESTDALPEYITCPECKHVGAQSQYSAVIMCQACNSKLSMPLDIIMDNDNVCPHCMTVLEPQSLITAYSAQSTIDFEDTDPRIAYKPQLKEGDVFDKYSIIRLLGKGGMAEVYLAKHLLLNRYCALKLMRNSASAEDPVFIKRFLREGKLLNSIDHANIVKVYDVGTDFKSGSLFIAMEYVKGKTLMEILREQVIAEDVLRDIIIYMAHALIALEEAHVVHRDIKPSNIMISDTGELKLMDLGIAKFESDSKAAGEMTLTMEKSTIGTPNYASPEQCRSAHNVDLRSDIYCLGATMYHLASGKLPFDGDTPVATILKVLQDEPVPLKELRPDLSDKLVNLIEWMMQKNPNDRPQNPDTLIGYIYSDAQDSSMGRKKVSDNNFLQLIGGKKNNIVNIFKKSMLALKIALAVVCVVVIAVNFKHLKTAFNYFVLGKRPQIKEVVDDSSQSFAAENIVVKELEMHPSGTVRKLSASLKDDHLPILSTEPLEKFEAFSLYDFSQKLPPLSLINKKNVKNGALIFTGRKRSILKDDQNFNNNGMVANSLYVEAAGFRHDIILSFDLCVDAKGDTDIVTMYSCHVPNEMMSIAVKNNSLHIYLLGRRYLVRNNIKIPRHKWFNITLSFNEKDRCCSLFFGDRFAGAYIMPGNWLPNRAQLVFGNASKEFTGKIAAVRVCHGKKDLPEQLGNIKYGKIMQSSKRPAAVLADNGAVIRCLPKNVNEWKVNYAPALQNGYTSKYNCVVIVDAEEASSLDLFKYIQKREISSYASENFYPTILFYEDKMSEKNTVIGNKNSDFINMLHLSKSDLPAVVFCQNDKIAACKTNVSKADFFDFMKNSLEDIQLFGSRNNSYYANSKDYLELRRRYLKKLQQDESALGKEAAKFVAKQIEKLEKQAKILEKNRSIAYEKRQRRQYSKERTEDLDLYLYSFAQEKDPQRRNSIKARLSDIMKDHSVDINAYLNKNVRDYCLGFLLKNSIARKELLGDKDFLQLVLAREFGSVHNIYIGDLDDIPEALYMYVYASNSSYQGEKNLNDILKKIKIDGTMHDLISMKPRKLSKAFIELFYYAPQVNGIYYDGNDAMQTAARHNNVQLAKYLWMNGFRSAYNKKYDVEKNPSPRQIALQCGSREFLEFYDSLKIKGDSSIPSSQVQYDFINSVRSRDYVNAQKYIRQGADPFMYWYNKFNAFDYVCAKNDLKMLKIFLTDKSINTKLMKTYKGMRRYSPVFIAAEMGSDDVLDVLLEYEDSLLYTGRNYNTQNSNSNIIISSSGSWEEVTLQLVLFSLEVGEKGNLLEMLKVLKKHNVLNRAYSSSPDKLWWYITRMRGNREKDQYTVVRYFLSCNLNPPVNYSYYYNLTPSARRLLEDARKKNIQSGRRERR